MSNIPDPQMAAPPLILAIDTSSPVAGYAIARGDRILASLTVNAEKPHSQTFFPTIETLCDLAGVAIAEFDLFAAVPGPGSFTGLRVGLAATKGLADSLGKPCVGINVLDLLAVNSECHGLCLITIGTSRQEVFCGLRRVSGEGRVETVGEDRVCAPSSVSALFVGQDAIWSHIGTGDLDWSPVARIVRVERDRINLAVTLAAVANRMVRNGRLPPLAAYYVRPSDAEIKKGPKI